MKMRYFVAGFIFIVCSLAALIVGQPISASCREATWSVGLPILVFLLMAVPSFLAYYAGKEAAMDDFSEGRF
jgi:TM2 domain-containing membrane protein YozV